MSRRWFVALLAFALSLAFALPAQASFCRTYEGKSICILQIKRSAKNYWEYRASVKVNGAIAPVETYDCRRRVKVQRNGKKVPFERGGPGELICRFANHKQ